jgi:hypothetical protein
VQALASEIFHLNYHAIQQALAASVFRLNRRNHAPGVIHLNHHTARRLLHLIASSAN